MATTSPHRPRSRFGLASGEKADPIGFAVSALNKLAQSDVLDRLKVRKQTEQAVYRSTRGGFRVVGAASRSFARKGGQGKGVRPSAATNTGLFDLTPSEDEQMLVDVVSEFATEVVRPAAAEANETCEAPADLLKASLEIGLPILGVPEALGGVHEERSAVTGVLVAEALGKGDMGLAVASLSSGSVATALGLWGTEEQQQTYLPAFTGDDVPAAALALNEPRVLFDVMAPATAGTKDADGWTLSGVKSLVPRGKDAELFVVGAMAEGRPALFLVESGQGAVQIEADPAMGVRAAAMTTLTLDGARAELLGDADGSTYAEAVRLARLGWCALSLGTAQAVLDYVIPYVKEREAFGEPVAQRQSVAFMVANIAIELEAMRLVTYKAAARVSQGKDAAREIALARKLCADKGMQIGLDGVQLLGGHGFVKEHPVERWYRDLRAIGVMEGSVLV